MNSVYKFAWCLWIGGTALIVGSWINLVSYKLGWIGFGIALSGTLLSIFSNRLSNGFTATSQQFLCDSCNLNHGNACWRPERPNAIECPDYDPSDGAA